MLNPEMAKLLIHSKLNSYKNYIGKNGSQIKTEYPYKKQTPFVKVVAEYSLLHKSGPFGRFPMLTLLDRFALKFLQ